MVKNLLIVFLILVFTLAAAALVLKDRPVSPLSFLHCLKLAGEWADVNFFTFDAPQKQAKYLEFAQRRADEFLLNAQKMHALSVGADFGNALKSAKIYDRPLTKLNESYRADLARAEYMAEQLSFLDYKFIPVIEKVYKVTLTNLEQFQDEALSKAYQQLFHSSAQEFNQKAIKVLLQKHQHTPADTQRYKLLVELRAAWVEGQKSTLSADQLQTLNKAKIILSQGREIEWAYDLLSSLGS